MELASMLGITYLTEKIQIHVNNDKKQDETTNQKHITGDVQGLPDIKIPSTIDISNLTPEAEIYLKEIVWKNRNPDRKTNKKMEPLSQNNLDFLNTEVDGHATIVVVDNSTKEVSEKHGNSKISKDNSTMELENQHETSEVPKISSNILAARNTITKIQDPGEVLHSDRGLSRVHKYEKQTCDECGAVLSSMHHLKNHQLTKHDSQCYKYQCDQCKYQTVHKAGLERHIITHHDKIRYPCNLCDYKATQKSSLKPHKESKHEGAQFTCEVCGTIFSMKQALRRHMEYMHGQRRHKCDSCDYIAGQGQHLTTHKKLRHSNLDNME